MTIFEILISVAVLILLFHLYSRFTRWIRKLITKLAKKKQVEKDSAYCLLRLAVNGELTHFLYDDEQSARQSYLERCPRCVAGGGNGGGENPGNGGGCCTEESCVHRGLVI